MARSVRDMKNLSGQAMGPKGLKTRTKLINVTVELLAKTSLRELKVVEIAQAAEMSSATFYLYFDSVIEVVLAAVDETSMSTPELITLLEQDWDPTGADDAALRFVRLYVAYWDDHRVLLRARNLAAEEGDARFVAARENSVRPLSTALAMRVAQGQARGRVPASVAPYALSSTIVMMLERLSALSGTQRARSFAITFDQLTLAAAETINWAFGIVHSTGTVSKTEE